MTKHVRTVEISETSDVRLRRLSDKTGLEPGEVIARALERFQDDLDDIVEDERRWAQFERDGKADPRRRHQGVDRQLGHCERASEGQCSIFHNGDGPALMERTQLSGCSC